MSLLRRYSNWGFSRGLVKISANNSFVCIASTLIDLFLMWSLKWWYLIVMCLVLGLCFGALANPSATFLSSKNSVECVTDNSGFICIIFAKLKGILLSRITFCMVWLSMVYSVLVVDDTIFNCILLTHNSWHPKKVIVYPVLDKTEILFHALVHDQNFKQSLSPHSSLIFCPISGWKKFLCLWSDSFN